MEKSVRASKRAIENRKNVKQHISSFYVIQRYMYIMYVFPFRKTQDLIEPMKGTLKEIDHNMKVQLDKICQAKSQIMKNDQRIQTLLNGRV